jgi:HTH-type transcriptional regulator, quorum sensing regulator NprR
MLDSNGRRRRLPGVDIRPGAVKQARQESRLSLAELAGGRVTRAAIHLIETGRSRPSMPVLEMIAERTGRPVSWFLAPGERLSSADLELEARLGEIEVLSEASDYEEALAAAVELSQRPLPEPAEARVRYLMGRAQVRLRKPSEAHASLTRARQLFEALEDHWMVVEVMDWQAGSLHLLEDPSALALQQEALRRCRTLDPVPVQTEIRLMTNLATVYTAHQEWPKAVQLYEEAVERARQFDNIGRLAQVYRGLGVAYRNLGDMTRAVTYTQKAVAFQALARDRAALCRAEEALGLLLIRQGDLASAQKHLESGLDRALAEGFEDVERYLRLALAELYLARGAHEDAEREAGLALAAKDSPNTLRARAQALLGRVKAAAGDAAAADHEFQAALGTLDPKDNAELMVEIHHAYAQVLKDRGDTSAALAEMEAAMALTRPGLTPASQRAARGA